jgi:hypothetical protein
MATDSTQYLIDMAARLTGGEASVATLAELGDHMLKAGATAADFERAIKTTSEALEQSAAATKLANDAVAEGEQSYRQAEIAADKAARAVEKLGATGKSWDDMTSKQVAATIKATEAADALKAEAVALDALKAKAGAVASQHASLTAGLKNVKGAAEQAAKAQAAASGSGKVNEIAEGLGKLGGPAGAAGQKIFGLATGFKKLSASIGSAGPYVAIGVAIIAIASAAAIATVAVLNWSIGLADANRTQGLLLDGIARTSEGGAELAATIDNLGTMVPSTREELMGMAKTLADTGLRGKELSTALEATAIKAAKLKFGPDFAAQMLSLDFQSKRLKENFASTFGGLKIDRLLEGLQTLVALFDSGTESGKALKFLFESLFQPLIDGTADAIPAVERLFLQAEILALKAFIAIKPYREEIAAVGKNLLIAAAVIGGILAGAIAILVASLGALAAAFGYVVSEVVEFGKLIVTGLADGITGGGAAVIDALTDVVNGAINKAKSLLGIASPSKVFEGLGGFTAEGFASGVDSGASDAQAALEAMVAPPPTGGAGGARGGANYGGVTIQITVDGRGESDDGLAAKIAAAVRDVFESDALMLGSGEAPA